MDEERFAALLAEVSGPSAPTARTVRAVWLRYVDGRTYARVGEALGVSRERSRELVARGQSMLRSTYVRKNTPERARFLDACPDAILDGMFAMDGAREWVTRQRADT